MKNTTSYLSFATRLAGLALALGLLPIVGSATNVDYLIVAGGGGGGGTIYGSGGGGGGGVKVHRRNPDFDYLRCCRWKWRSRCH